MFLLGEYAVISWYMRKKEIQSRKRTAQESIGKTQANPVFETLKQNASRECELYGENS